MSQAEIVYIHKLPRNSENTYGQVSHEVLYNNTSLSLTDKGFLTVILSMDSRKPITVNALKDVCKEHKDTIRTYLDRLETLKFIQKKELINRHGYFPEYQYFINEFAVRELTKRTDQTTSPPTDRKVTDRTDRKVPYVLNNKINNNNNKKEVLSNGYKIDLTKKPPNLKTSLPILNKNLEKEKVIMKTDPLQERKIEIAKRLIAELVSVEKVMAWDYVKSMNKETLQIVENQLNWRKDYCNEKEEPWIMFLKCVKANYSEPKGFAENHKPFVPIAQSDQRYDELFEWCLVSINLRAPRIIDKKDEFSRYFLERFYSFYISKSTDTGKEDFDIKLKIVPTLISFEMLEEMFLEAVKNNPHKVKSFANQQTVDLFMRNIRSI